MTWKPLVRSGVPLASLRPTQPVVPSPPPSRPFGALATRSKMALTANSASPLAPISMTWPKPPRVRPAPALSGRSSFFQKITGATFSVASTGMVRTPDGKAMPSSPSLVGRAPVPPELKVMISKSSVSAAWPETWEPPRNGGFHSAEEPSALTRVGHRLVQAAHHQVGQQLADDVADARPGRAAARSGCSLPG